MLQAPWQVGGRANTTTAFLFSILSLGNVSDVCRWREGEAIAPGSSFVNLPVFVTSSLELVVFCLL